MNVNQFAKLWVVHDIAQWRYYEGYEPGWSNPEHHRHERAYHSYFASPPYAGWLSRRDPRKRRNTDKPPVPLYFTVSLQPDLRVALARLRLSAYSFKLVDTMMRITLIANVG